VVSAIGARYHLGVDGIESLADHADDALNAYCDPVELDCNYKAATYLLRPELLLESAMIGVFVSLDLLLFYSFFEASLVPMFFLLASGEASGAFMRRSSFLFTRRLDRF